MQIQDRAELWRAEFFRTPLQMVIKQPFSVKSPEHVETLSPEMRREYCRGPLIRQSGNVEFTDLPCGDQTHRRHACLLNRNPKSLFWSPARRPSDQRRARDYWTAGQSRRRSCKHEARCFLTKPGPKPLASLWIESCVAENGNVCDIWVCGRNID